MKKEQIEFLIYLGIVGVLPSIPFAYVVHMAYESRSPTAAGFMASLILLTPISLLILVAYEESQK